MNLLKALTEARGAPGFEGEVRRMMRRELQDHADEVLYDHTGSIFGKKRGAADAPRVLLAGHMDEVAFMVSEITDDGYLRFKPLGGWWEQVLLSQRVEVVTEQRSFTGVIGSRPPHVLTKEEREKVFPMKEMYVDIGAGSKNQAAAWGVAVGDPIVPVCPYEELADEDTILAKALDNRVGCYAAVEVLKQLNEGSHPNEVYAGATVQEEVGLRGAETAPHVVQPDVAIALDVGIAEDGPSEKEKNKPKLGGGPLVTFLDATMIPNTRFRDLIVETAEENGISHQVEVMTGGGTDAGKFNLYKRGVPTVVIGVAARYIHSNVSMVSRQDVDRMVRLLAAVIDKLDAETVRYLCDYR
ncbi:MAG TPA: M42 family metallopeptidase [Bacillales bacterium]|nr:M42 family metallopeptidase [Bacillales bacterium]